MLAVPSGWSRQFIKSAPIAATCNAVIFQPPAPPMPISLFCWLLFGPPNKYFHFKSDKSSLTVPGCVGVNVHASIGDGWWFLEEDDSIGVLE